MGSDTSAIHYNAVRVAGGLSGTRRTVRTIKGLIRDGGRSWLVRRRALEIVAGVPGRDTTGEIGAIFDFLTQIPFRADPHFLELVETPERALAEIDQGYGFGLDCDGFVTLGGALLRSIGYPVQLVLIGESAPDQYQHIYLRVLDRNLAGWIPFDPTVPDKPLGWEYPPDRTAARWVEGFGESDELSGPFPRSRSTRIEPVAISGLAGLGLGAVTAAGSNGPMSIAPGTQPEVDADRGDVEREILELMQVAPGAGGQVEEVSPLDFDPGVFSPGEIPEEGIDLVMPGADQDGWQTATDESGAEVEIDIYAGAEQGIPSEGLDLSMSDQVGSIDISDQLVREIIAAGKATQGIPGERVDLITAIAVASMAMMGQSDAEKIIRSMAQNSGDGLGRAVVFRWISKSWIGKTIRKIVHKVAYIFGDDAGPVIEGLLKKALVALVQKYAGQGAANLAYILLENIDGVKEYIVFAVRDIARAGDEKLKQLEADVLDDFGQSLNVDTAALYAEAKVEIALVTKDVEAEIKRIKKNLKEQIAAAQKAAEELVSSGKMVAKDAFGQLERQTEYFRGRAEALVTSAEEKLAHTIDEYSDVLEAGKTFIDAKMEPVATGVLFKIEAAREIGKKKLAEKQIEISRAVKTGVLTIEEGTKRLKALETEVNAEIEKVEREGDKVLAAAEKEAKAIQAKINAEWAKIEARLQAELRQFISQTGAKSQAGLVAFIEETGPDGIESISAELADRGEDIRQIIIDKGIDNAALKQALHNFQIKRGFDLNMASMSAAASEVEILALRKITSIPVPPEGLDIELADAIGQYRQDLLDRGILDPRGVKISSDMLARGLDLVMPGMTEKDADFLFRTSEQSPAAKQKLKEKTGPLVAASRTVMGTSKKQSTATVAIVGGLIAAAGIGGALWLKTRR